MMRPWERLESWNIWQARPAQNTDRGNDRIELLLRHTTAAVSHTEGPGRSILIEAHFIHLGTKADMAP